MEKIKHLIQAHPWATAGIVFIVGIIIIYWFSSGSSSSSGSTTVSGTPMTGSSDAVQVAQLQENAQAQALAASVDIAHINAEAGNTQATTAAAALTTAATDQLQAQETQFNDQLAASISTNTTALAATEQNDLYAFKTAKNANATAITAASIAADVSKTQLNDQLAGLENTNATSVTLGNLSLAGLENTNQTTAEDTGTLAGLDIVLKEIEMGTAPSNPAFSVVAANGKTDVSTGGGASPGQTAYANAIASGNIAQADAIAQELIKNNPALFGHLG